MKRCAIYSLLLGILKIPKSAAGTEPVRLHGLSDPYWAPQHSTARSCPLWLGDGTQDMLLLWYQAQSRCSLRERDGMGWAAEAEHHQDLLWLQVSCWDGYREKEFKEQPQEQILVQCGKAGSKSLWKTWLFQVTVLGYASGYYSWILSMWLHCIIAQAGVFINRAIIPWQICAKSVIQPGAGQRGPLTLLLGFSC